MGRSWNPVPRLDCGDSSRDEPGDDDEERCPLAAGEVVPPTGGASVAVRLGRRYRRRDDLATCGASRWSEGDAAGSSLVPRRRPQASPPRMPARRGHSEMRAVARRARRGRVRAGPPAARRSSSRARRDRWLRRAACRRAVYPSYGCPTAAIFSFSTRRASETRHFTVPTGTPRMKPICE